MFDLLQDTLKLNDTTLLTPSGAARMAVKNDIYLNKINVPYFDYVFYLC